MVAINKNIKFRMPKYLMELKMVMKFVIQIYNQLILLNERPKLRTKLLNYYKIDQCFEAHSKRREE